MDNFSKQGPELHADYVDAINSNDIDQVMALLSDDVVFQVAGEPELIGKSAVREWGASFFEAFDAHYEKAQLAFEKSGMLAIDRYVYSARFVGREDGEVITEHGKGVAIYRQGEGGSWHIILDGWSPDEVMPVDALAS
ncbi:nuclear transport factor 2 family protein [Altererythrobacter sp. BO-6]|uniref:YybH family protein n=1 Tax=Altererythrobacter sp. BO-6 TaxID=2604537 RepID=UPI0013E18FB7|nr:nuclear transport factor 2 family protein [Altererythrobacter sp. BO-6]QIG54938.1 nuclear transport factor 2 family protein [Altererythrobacter sp. BO-6]